MNILVGILFILSALITFLGLVVDEDYYIVVHVIRSIISFSALVIMFIIGAQIWMYILGVLSVAIHITIIIKVACDWDIPLFIAIDICSFFAALAVGIAIFF